LEVGSTIIASEAADILPGNALPLSAMPIGIMVHNIELQAGRGGQLARAAGAYAQFVGRSGVFAILKMRSGEIRQVRSDCWATVGVVSNPDHQNIVLGKAGRARWLGRRPVVRGVAMNPIDHPHGGGEGRTSGGRHPVTPWGKKTKGKKTRSNKKNSHIIRSRKSK
jgi:large subunit ribosomal protein L2